MTVTKTQIQVTQRTLNRININNLCIDIIFELKNKNKNKKADKEKF